MPRLLGTMARTAAITGTATAVSGRVARRQAGRWAQQQAPAPAYAAPAPAPAAPVPPPQAPAAAASMDDKIEQLKELGALREQGILSDAEFEAQKARILGS